MREKVILGTVQLGKPYGVNNSTGMPTEREAFEILDFAYTNGIKLLDSADAYGEALVIIGKYHKATSNYFELISKFKVDNFSIALKLELNLKLTGLSSLYGYMYHDFADYESGVVSTLLIDLKNEHLIERIGVSLYSVEQLEKVIFDSSIDLIQLPVNLLDISKKKIELLRLAKASGKEIHARSVFLQGLFMCNSDFLPGNLVALSSYLSKLSYLAKELNMDLKKYALNYVLHKEYIDRVILGVERAHQLQENLSLLEFNFSSQFDGINIEPSHAYLLNPSNWQL